MAAVSVARQKKEAVVSEVSEQLRGATAVIVVDYRGLNVEALNTLRSQLNADDVQLQVVKNTLARLALAQADMAEVLDGLMGEWLTGPTAFAFAAKDPMVAAKHLVDFSDDHDDLEIKGGLLNGKLVNPEQIKALADLPSREVLLTRVAVVFNAPIQRVAMAFNAPLQQLALLTEALRQKREEEAA